VTGYVRLDSPHRSHDSYLELGQRLLGIGLPTIAYHQPLDQCWLARHHEAHGVKVEPSVKDSLAYHCVQHEKSAWLRRASQAHHPATLIWMDYGILHVPGVTEDLIRQFYEHVDACGPVTKIHMPSIWRIDTPVTSDAVSWICAGGVMVMPSRDAEWWHRECRVMAASHAPTWEVNTWARIVKKHPELVRMYRADHDSTILTGIAS
jgi:hypothetical protein